MNRDLIERIVEINRRVWDEWPAAINASNVEAVRQAAAEAVAAAALEASVSEGERRGLERAAEVASRWRRIDPATKLAVAEHFGVSEDDMVVAVATADGIAAAIRALIPEAPAREGWQPIETAPKDGTAILAYNTRNTGHHAVVVLWKDWNLDPDIGDEPHWADAATAGSDALYYNGGFFDYWQPLPAPPPSQDQREG